MIPTKEQAWDLLCEYNEGEFHRLHARIVGDVMRYFAVQLGYADEADFWQTVGILHDLDFEQYPDQHCTKEAEILREKGVDERLIHAVVSHGYLLTVDVQPEHQMEKVLYATDELTGLIGAVVRMLPTVFLPFNAFKGGLNAALTLLLYKPLMRALRLAHLVPESGAAKKGASLWNAGTLLAAAVLAATCVLILLAVKKVI